MAQSLCGILIVIVALTSSIEGLSLHSQRMEKRADVDPDASRTFSQIITSKGYPCEEHRVTTPDGYILTIFRIPHGRGSTKTGTKPVFLQHGLLDSSFTWIINFPNQSLPYLLANMGYDVWMGNVRGNRYALEHTTLNPSESAFWDFSWDEHALIDLPSMVDYILETTSTTKLSYVGHSQGTTIMFAAMSAVPTLRSKINLFVALGPVVTIQNQEVEGLTLLIDLRVPETLYWLGLRNFLERPGLIFKYIGEEFCFLNPTICDSMIELVAGPHQHAFNDSRMDVMATHEPGGTSVKNMMHWAQMYRAGAFARFDYGSTVENIKHYNSTMPPHYAVSKFPTFVPLCLVYGGEDYLADPTDVTNLIGRLPTPPVSVLFKPEYAHLDFVWATDAVTEVYPTIFKLLSTYA